MKSFISYDSQSDFSIYNIPFGVAVFEDDEIACVTRVGDTVINLAVLFDKGYFDQFDLEENVFEAFALNDFIRSEEHTSELQSRGHLVCRLLLEKKNLKLHC